MNYKNSVFYRIMAGSWVLGWLFTTSAPEPDWYRDSISYNWGRKIIKLVSAWLSIPGRYLDKYGSSSLVISNLTGLLGLVIFLYLIQDLLFNDYSWYRVVAELLLLVLAVAMLFAKRHPQTWTNSIFYRLPLWWRSQD